MPKTDVEILARNYLEEELAWKRGPHPTFPYEAKFHGERLVIRLNDFPDEKLYTLIVNDEEVDSFDDWPDQWAKP